MNLRSSLFSRHDYALDDQEQTQHSCDGNADSPCLVETCGGDDILNSAQESTPNRVPMTFPTPPVNIVPPMMEEAMAFISIPLAWDAEPDPT